MDSFLCFSTQGLCHFNAPKPLIKQATPRVWSQILKQQRIMITLFDWWWSELIPPHVRECNLFIHYISYVSIPSFSILFAAAFLSTTAGNPGLFLLEQTCKAGVNSTFLWVGQKAKKHRRNIPQNRGFKIVWRCVVFMSINCGFCLQHCVTIWGKVFQKPFPRLPKKPGFWRYLVGPQKTTYLIQTPPFTHFSGCIWGRPGIWGKLGP